MSALDQPGIIYRVGNGDLWGVQELKESTAVLFCVEPSEQTLFEFATFLEDNRHQLDTLQGSDLLIRPERRVMTVDLRWFERRDVERVSCGHTHGGCRREGEGLYCDDCGLDVVLAEGEDCPACGGDLGDEGGHCGCPAALKAEAEVYAQFAYMAPLAAQYNRARREGDDELAEAIEAEALR